MVVGSFKELLNLIILYQMMYITDWSKYCLGCMNNYHFIQNIQITSVGRGDSSHHATRGGSSHSPLRGEKTDNQKTVITIRKGRILLVNDQGLSQIAFFHNRG